MLARKCIILWCLPLLLLLGCVSKTKYVALEGELGTTQQKLQAEIDAAEKAIADLNRQKGDLSDENIRLLSTIEALKTELRQEKIAVVEKVIEISEIEKTRREIESSLKEQIEQKEIRLEEVEGKLKVTFVDKILFDSGSIAIKPRGQEVLLTLSESFKERKDQTILVEGHTDNVEIGPVLQAKSSHQLGIVHRQGDGRRTFPAGKGRYRAGAPDRPPEPASTATVASNDTPEGRALKTAAHRNHPGATSERNEAGLADGLRLLILVAQGCQIGQVTLAVHQPLLIVQIVEKIIQVRPDIESVGIDPRIVGHIDDPQGVKVNQHAHLAVPPQQIASSAQRIQKKRGILVHGFKIGFAAGGGGAGSGRKSTRKTSQPWRARPPPTRFSKFP